MTPSYEEMTDDELDRLAAETFLDIRKALLTRCRYYVSNKGAATAINNFNPTDPDSNQIERYVFPKLRQLCDIQIEYDYSPSTKNVCWRFEICKKDCNYHDWSWFRWLDRGLCENYELNRAILICALKAMDKLPKKTDSEDA